MQFEFQIGKNLKSDAEGYSIIDGKDSSAARQSIAMSNTNFRGSSGFHNINAAPQVNQLDEIIDRMGNASSKSQGLGHVITTASRLFTSSDKLYLRSEKNTVIGLLKIGSRKLFIRNESGQIKEIQPLCVLDFYVHESVQRGGQGKQIFEKMLQVEGVRPEKLAYDRPSPKLIGFLKKHYGLSSYVPQNNNYVVFNAYFTGLVQKPPVGNEAMNVKKDQRQQEQYGMSLNNMGRNPHPAPKSYALQMQQQQQQLAEKQQQQQQNTFYSQTRKGVTFADEQANLPPNRVNNTMYASNFKDRQNQTQMSRKLSDAGLKVLDNNQQSLQSQQQRGTPSQSNSYYERFNQNKDGNMQQQQLPPRPNLMSPATSQQSNNPNRPKDSVANLLSFSDDQSNQSKTNGQRRSQSSNHGGMTPYDYQMKQLDAKITATQSNIAKQQTDMNDIMAKTNATGSNFNTNQNQQEQKVSMDGPTSLGAIYNKRNNHAVLNEYSKQKINEHRQFVNYTNSKQLQGNVPWGSNGYNYQNGNIPNRAQNQTLSNNRPF